MNKTARICSTLSTTIPFSPLRLMIKNQIAAPTATRMTVRIVYRHISGQS